MKNLNIEMILKETENFTLTENDSYIQTYPEFLKYFEKINPGEINEHNLIIASHFVYGCAVENRGSICVLEKSGMLKEGRGRQILPLKSGWSDNFEYSILETDERKN